MNKMLKNFEKSLTRLGITEDDIEEAKQNLILPELGFEIERQLNEDGLVLDNGVEDENIKLIAPHNLFTYKYHPVFVYIRDQRLKEQKWAKKDYNRFHLTHDCVYLKDARKEHRYKKRYVVTYRTDGKFLINVQDRESKKVIFEDSLVNLKVCQGCLAEINWENKAKKFFEERENLRLTKGPVFRKWDNKLSELVESFDLKEYLEWARANAINTYKEFTKLHTAYSLVKKEYKLKPEEKWRLKAMRNWTCQKCGQTHKEKLGLQIHHIDHNEGNNVPQNLMIVCTSCHKDIHMVEGGVFNIDE